MVKNVSHKDVGHTLDLAVLVNGVIVSYLVVSTPVSETTSGVAHLRRQLRTLY